MRLNPVELLQPVFEFLDGLIRDDGDILFMVFVYVAIPFLAWVLSGGLRRKLYRGKPAPHVTIWVYIPIGRPPPQPPPSPPSLVGSEPDPFPDHDGDSSAA